MLGEILLLKYVSSSCQTLHFCPPGASFFFQFREVTGSQAANTKITMEMHDGTDMHAYYHVVRFHYLLLCCML